MSIYLNVLSFHMSKFIMHNQLFWNLIAIDTHHPDETEPALDDRKLSGFRFLYHSWIGSKTNSFSF